MLQPTLTNKSKEYIEILIVIFFSKKDTSCTASVGSFLTSIGELSARGRSLEKASWDTLPKLEFKLSWSSSSPNWLLDLNWGWPASGLKVELANEKLLNPCLYAGSEKMDRFSGNSPQVEFTLEFGKLDTIWGCRALALLMLPMPEDWLDDRERLSLVCQ